MALPEGNLLKSDFRRGMLFDVNDHAAPEDSVKFINNMLPSPLHALTTRNGRTRKSTATIGTLVYDVFRWLKSASVASYENIVAYNAGSDELRYADNDGTTTTDHVTSLTAGNPVIGMQAKYRLYLNNGIEETKVLVEDSVIQARSVGISVATALVDDLAADQGGAGSFGNETFRWVITVVYGEDGESNPSNEVTFTPNASTQVDLEWSAPDEPAGMTRSGYRIYRAKDTGTPTFELRFVTEVGPGETTYSDDNAGDTTDATVAGNALVEDNHNVAPTGLAGMVWWDYENIAIGWGENSQIDGAGDTFPQRLWFSELGNPEIWKTEVDTLDATNTAEFQDVPQEARDNSVVTVVTNGSLAYVFNRFGVRVLTPTSVSRAYKVDMVANSADHGIIGPKAVTVTDAGDIYYVSTDGVRLIRGRIDVEVNPNTDSASRGLVTSPGIGAVGVSVNSIIHGVPKGLRQFVYAHEYRDRVHISMGTDAITGEVPTRNNDVLIFDIPSPGFVYSQGRNVYGWATVNDSGNDYQLWGCGYTSPVSAPTTTNGNYWREYDPGAVSDEDAEGSDIPIEWIFTDFNRAVPAFNVGKLREMLIDAAVSNGTLTASVSIDSGRLTTSKQFTFQSATRTAWQESSYWQNDPSNNLQETATAADFNTGDAYSDLVATFESVPNGSYIVNDGGGNDTVSNLDFTGVTDTDGVTAVLDAGAVAAGSNVHWDFVKSPGYWRCTHNTPGAANSVVVSGLGPGEDLVTATYLFNGASNIVYQAVDPNGIFAGLDWVASGVTDPANVWSSGVAIRGAPRRALFHGERAQMMSVSISCTTIMTIYGYRIRYHVLEPIGAGVT